MFSLVKEPEPPVEPPEKPQHLCPICGGNYDYLYRDWYDEIAGCDHCVYAVYCEDWE